MRNRTMTTQLILFREHNMEGPPCPFCGLPMLPLYAVQDEPWPDTTFAWSCDCPATVELEDEHLLKVLGIGKEKRDE